MESNLAKATMGLLITLAGLMACVLILALTGCTEHKTVTVREEYDDSSLQQMLYLMSVRQATSETQIQEIKEALQLLELNQSAGEAELELLAEEHAAINSVLDDIEAMVEAGQTQMAKVCSSNEYLFVTPSGIYAVFMVSNNYGTSLGRLSENVLYQTTDSTETKFKIVNKQVVCQ